MDLHDSFWEQNQFVEEQVSKWKEKGGDFDKISMGRDDMEAFIFPAHFGSDYMADYFDEF